MPRPASDEGHAGAAVGQLTLAPGDQGVPSAGNDLLADQLAVLDIEGDG